jgi:hypothetical protein
MGGNLMATIDTADLMLNRVEVGAPALEGGNIAESAVSLLYDLNLLPPQNDLEKAGQGSAAFTGPPQTVALIEAGGTAISKWWATGGSVLILAVWGAVTAFWNNSNNTDLHGQLVWSGAILSAALVLGIAYLLSSDMRGRSLAMVETIQARREIGMAFIAAASQHPTGASAALPSAALASAAPSPQILPVQLMNARNLDGADSSGWHVIAMQPNADAAQVKYLLVKGEITEWVGSSSVHFSAHS